MADKNRLKSVRSILRTCRVLHICAGKVAERKKVPALHLVAVEDGKNRRSTINASDFVKQIYIKNCALCVLSRFGLIDDVYDINECDPSTEYIEAVHMAGRCQNILFIRIFSIYF